MVQERFKLVCAVHLFLIKNQRILLLRRFNTGYEDGNYSLPAGHLDGGERATRAMLRETKEEIGVTIKIGELNIAHVMHRKSIQERIDTLDPLSINPEPAERIDFFFLATKWKGKPTLMEQDKCDDLRWFPIHELPQNTIPYVKSAIESYCNGVFFSEFGWN